MDNETHGMRRWKIIGIVVLILMVLSHGGQIGTVNSRVSNTNHQLSELKQTIEKQQKQINDLKRELEELKREK